MNGSALTQALVKKGERALSSAKTDLREGDMDSAVNRAYYAMFNMARAALLSAGTPESDLPRTHNGLIAEFGETAVKARGLDPSSDALSAELSHSGCERTIPVSNWSSLLPRER